MKKALALMLSLALTMALVGCGNSNTTPPASSGSAAPSTSEPAAGGEALNISVVLKTLSSEYWNYVKAGCDAAAADLGVTVTVVGPGAESEIEQQVAMIEQQIGSGCDAIVVAPNDAGAAANALKAAVDGGIPVLAVDTDVNMEGQTSFVGTSNVDAAAKGGAYAAELRGTDAKAVIIYGQEGDNTSNMRREGYNKALTEAGITILAEQSGQNTTDGATKTMEDLLTAYPDEIDIVLCHNDDTAIGAMNACKSAGVEGVTIIGFDGNKSAVELILAGNLEGTVAQQPYMMGYQVVEAAVKAAKGETVEKTIYADALMVNKDNGQKYIDDLAAMLG